jgi:hypothetical protein
LTSPQLHLFEASFSGQKVKFMIQQTPDQIVHVAVASCRVCYRNRNFHYARNGGMVCGKREEAMNFEPKAQNAGPNHCALVEVPHVGTDRDLTVLSHDVIEEAANLPQ